MKGPRIEKVYRCTSICPCAENLNGFPPFSCYGPIVKIVAGEEQSEHLVHKGLITHYSSYFRAAYGGNFLESTTGVTNLTDEDPEIVEAFISWLYTHRLSHFDGRYCSDRTDEYNEYRRLIALLVFADRRGVAALQNAVIDELFNMVARTWRFPLSEIPVIYENTHEKSLLRRFIVDLVRRTIRDLDGLKNKDVLMGTPEFFCDLACAARRPDGVTFVESPGKFCRVDRCEYHVHPLLKPGPFQGC